MPKHRRTSLVFRGNLDVTAAVVGPLAVVDTCTVTVTPDLSTTLQTVTVTNARGVTARGLANYYNGRTAAAKRVWEGRGRRWYHLRLVLPLAGRR